ncbi:DEAD/DEAH box helicase [Jeotgalibaca caeni]|uniref:DEAD/DEAH box helicase n=1 Tax=Jeotgalibaca caeni TaxID=3028623 RepID=UPI00237DCFBC|nr:DEAD/DEAH box helicase [Jeotgalibaca caeni]MDE1548226.1 DEAD/DEAH box helicase [Jeotgalibaca caeni]
MMIEKMNPNFQRYWKGLRFQLPTPIQERVFEPLMEGKDVIGLSPTGTGKTLAYALPLLQKTQPNGELQLVILTPSQELGVQVGRVVEEWGGLKDLKVQTIIGGANTKRQVEKLKEKPEVVVGTPGRLLELAEQRKLKLHQLKTVVLDEADYLLKDEHLPNLRMLVKKMPGQCQMTFFSATNSETLSQIDRWFNVDPVVFDAASEDGIRDQTVHGYLEVENRRRAESLRRLGNIKGMQALVFVNSVQELDYLAEKMTYEGVPVRMLHSDYGPSQRKHALESFRNGEAVFLLTTDVSARGIDIEDLPYVINYDLPLTREVYLHRSGRTGRMGKEGRVVSLVTERGIREIRKMVPRSDEFQRWYLYSGDLVSEIPDNMSEKPIKPVKTVKPEVKKAPPKKERTEAAPVKKIKKKARTRDQKNKGARKK